MSEPRGYGQGLEDGKILQRLDGHDKHFDRINGSMEKIAARLGGVELLLQQIMDKADSRAASGKADLAARDATVISVADALKKTDEARRASIDQRWTPIQRVMAVIALLVTIAVATVTIVATR
jgi:hypothetical protein